MNSLIDISDVLLKTDRMTLRPWRETDLQDFFAYARVDGVGQMAGWLPHKTIEESAQVLKMFIDGKRTFAVEKEDRVIGSVGIEEYDEEKHPEVEDLQGREIGYVLSKDYWGQGLMPEAVRAVIAYLFDEVGLDFVIAGHFDWNSQSARVIEKCGFRYVKTIKYETRYDTVENSREYILHSPKRRKTDAN